MTEKRQSDSGNVHKARLKDKRGLLEKSFRAPFTGSRKIRTSERKEDYC